MIYMWVESLYIRHIVPVIVVQPAGLMNCGEHLLLQLNHSVHIPVRLTECVWANDQTSTTCRLRPLEKAKVRMGSALAFVMQKLIQ
jgi:hypothetical protein